LTKADVLEVSQQQPYFKSDADRLVGSGFFDSLKSIIGKVLPILAPIGKDFLRQQGAVGETAANVLGALGMGQSGGMRMAMGRSGGKSKLMERMM
jgi:hypothetical protein